VVGALVSSRRGGDIPTSSLGWQLDAVAKIAEGRANPHDEGTWRHGRKVTVVALANGPARCSASRKPPILTRAAGLHPQ